jgi:hypothetical protein
VGEKERRSPEGAVDSEVHNGAVEDDGGLDSRSSAVKEYSRLVVRLRGIS